MSTPTLAYAYYNEIDPFAADWLEALIDVGAIAAGYVDRTPIQDVDASFLSEFTQHHFFAGIGGWSLALRLAGWPDDRAVWTGSCPCQPFSAAGKGKGTDDARHRWPDWYRLIADRRPAVVFGEQVASKAGRAWLGSVRVDLEGLGYGVGAADLCAAGVGAPHIRQRLWFGAARIGEYGSRDVGVGHADIARPQGRSQRGHRADERATRTSGVDSGMADDMRTGRGISSERNGTAQRRIEGRELGHHPDGCSDVCGGVGNASQHRDRQHVGELPRDESEHAIRGSYSDHASFDPSTARHLDPIDLPDFWSPVDWLPCTDGVSRPVEPGSFPLAHGVLGRVGRLRGYGNAIVPACAAEFIAAWVEAAAEVEAVAEVSARR